MTRYGLVCLLLGSLSWSQATSSRSTSGTQQPDTLITSSSKATVSDLNQQAETSNVGPDRPVITIRGLCDTDSADKAAASDCKTVISQAQFEKVIAAIQLDMTARVRREFALRYANALVLTKKAEQMGLDKGANYEEQMKLARIDVLSRELKKVIQEKVLQISDKDIEDYYHNNTVRFEKAELDRIYIPKTYQLPMSSDKKLTGANRQELSQESEQTIKVEAENIRARAVAGGDFTKLQADAYHAAGIKNATFNTSISVRRTSLPSNQVSVMDLKPGEVSSVLADPKEYVIYKMKSKNTLALDQAREEIRAILSTQRMQDEMRRIQDSASLSLDESYFVGSLPESGMKLSESTKAAATLHSGDPNQ